MNREELFGDVRAIALREMSQLAARDHGALKAFLEPLLGVAASALARSLVDLDADLSTGSVRRAALRRLRHYGVRALVDGSPISAATSPLPSEGPLLVLSNHPGLFDAMILFASIGREDLGVLAARRELLAVLPGLSERMVYIDEGARGAFALKRAIRHLRGGGALLHFPAGHIEPDPALVRDEPCLHAWEAGVSALLAAGARSGLRAVVACVSGVVSPRARGLAARVAGRSGATDAIVPLLQLTLPWFRDSTASVAFGPIRSVTPELSSKLLASDLDRLVRARQSDPKTSA